MSTLDAAIYAAERGFRVFPVKARVKEPAFTDWQAIATTDIEQIRRWFKSGRYNVGIATGPMGDGRWVVVVDFDCKDGKHGLGSLANMEALRLLPPTLRVRTPSGGVHLFYLVPADCGLTLSADRIPGFPGVDVRCDTALVVAPGSTFEGKAYEWANDLPMAEAPEELVALLLSGQGQKRKVASRDRLAEDDTTEGVDRARWFLEHEAESAIQGSGGNNATFRVIARVRDFAVSREMASVILEELWNNDEERVSPSWPPEEFDEIISNAYDFASYPAGIGLASVEFDVVPYEDDGPIDIFGHGDPVSLSSPPQGSLPPMLQRWVRSEARRKGVPEAFAAASAITTIAAAVGGSLRIQVRQRDTGWTEPAALWCVLVAPPGHVKSPTLSAAVRPLHQQDQAFRREWRPKFERWKKMSASRAKDAPDPGPEPICRRTAVDNFTTEKLIRIMADNPEGVLCTSDELMALLGSFGAYKASGEGDRAHMLRMFDGNSIVVDRVTGDSLSADSALLSILAGTQPDKLAKLIGDMGADGLLQRFLFLIHDGLERSGLDEEPDGEAERFYSRLVQGLASQELIVDFAEPIKLTEEAGALLAREADDLRGLKDLVGMGTAWPGHVEKWGKFLPRLVLTFHAIVEFERAGQVDPLLPIDASTVRMASLFAAFLMRHSMAFHEAFGVRSPAANEALEIAGSLLLKPELKKLIPRDVYQLRRSLRGEENRRLLLNVMGQLEVAGWVEALDRRADGPTGWRVDPRVHTRFAEHAERVRATREEQKARIMDAGKQKARIARAGAR